MYMPKIKILEVAIKYCLQSVTNCDLSKNTKIKFLLSNLKKKKLLLGYYNEFLVHLLYYKL